MPDSALDRVRRWLLYGSDDLGTIKLTNRQLLNAIEYTESHLNPDLAIISRGVERDHREFWERNGPRRLRVVKAG
jgi:hypothetical protein